MDPQNKENTRNEDGTWKPGVSGNPGGRPKNTIKAYLQRKFSKMSEEEMELWLKEHNIPGDLQWKMAEGNPHNTSDVDLDVKPKPLLDALRNNNSNPQDSGNDEEN